MKPGKSKHQIQKIPVGHEERLIFETMDDGKTFMVSIGKENVAITRSDLMGLLFLYADKHQQEDLLTMEEVKMKPIARLLTFVVDQDMKKGDKINAFYQYLLPIAYADKLIAGSPHKYKEARLSVDDPLIKEMKQLEL